MIDDLTFGKKLPYNYKEFALQSNANLLSGFQDIKANRNVSEMSILVKAWKEKIQAAGLHASLITSCYTHGTKNLMLHLISG